MTPKALQIWTWGRSAPLKLNRHGFGWGLSPPCFTVVVILGRRWGPPAFLPKIMPGIQAQKVQSCLLVFLGCWRKASVCHKALIGMLQWWLNSRTVCDLESGSLELSQSDHWVLGYVSEWLRPLCAWESSVQQNVFVAFNRSTSWRSAVSELWRQFFLLHGVFFHSDTCENLWSPIFKLMSIQLSLAKVNLKRRIKHSKEKWNWPKVRVSENSCQLLQFFLLISWQKCI